MSNIFTKLAKREHENDSKLGMPSTDRAHYGRRMHLMSTIRGGKGFRTPASVPQRDAQGLTRGDRKRAPREATNAKVSESRPYLFMHSAARARWRAEQVRAAA